MKNVRRKHTASFKADVALAALKERETLAELSKQFEVHGNKISEWKQICVKRMKELFETKSAPDTSESEKELLYAKIGRLEMELEWAKKKLQQHGQLKIG
jgi:transposase